MTIDYASLEFPTRVKETSTTTGTGTYSLDGAVASFRTFVAGAGTGNSVIYMATMGLSWEYGKGTVTDGTPDTLTRDEIIKSTNANAAVDWAAGVKTLFVFTPGELIEQLAAGGGSTLPFPLSAPSSPDANNDELTTASLDAAWSVQGGFSASGATITPDFDGTWLRLDIPASATEAARRYLIRKAISGIGTSTAFTMVARIALSSMDSLSAPEVSISWGDNSAYNTGNACLLKLTVSSTNRVIGAYTVGFTEATQNLPLGASMVYIAFRRNSDNTLDTWYSLDGLSWRFIWGGSSRTYAFTYLFLNMSGHSSGTSVTTCMVDFFRINDTRFNIPRPV